jgi:hypothetical protein
MYMDLPEKAKSIPAKIILDGAENGQTKLDGVKLDSSKDLEFGKNKFPCRETVVDQNGNKTKSRVILAETRLYTLVVGGPKDFATSKEAAAFIDSFEITK